MKLKNWIRGLILPDSEIYSEATVWYSCNDRHQKSMEQSGVARNRLTIKQVLKNMTKQYDGECILFSIHGAEKNEYL